MPNWPVPSRASEEGFAVGASPATIPTTCWNAPPSAATAAPNLQKVLPGAWACRGTCGLAALPAQELGAWPQFWGQAGAAGDRFGFGFKNDVWAAKGGGWGGGDHDGTWERSAGLQNSDLEDSLLACSPALISAFSHKEAFEHAPAPAAVATPSLRALACSPVLTGAVTTDVGRWDLMLSKELPTSFLEDRSNTLTSLATQSVQVQRDAFLAVGDEDEVDDGGQRVASDRSDNSRLQEGEWFLSGASWSSEEDLISVASAEESGEHWKERRILDVGGYDGSLDPYAQEVEHGFAGLSGSDSLYGDYAGGRLGSVVAACSSAVEPAALFNMDLAMQDDLEGYAREVLGDLVNTSCETPRHRSVVLEYRSNAVLTDICSQYGAQGPLQFEERPRPQFPSLTSVFGSCNGSNSVFHCVPGSSHRPQLPSLNSIFGTCGSSCVSTRQPALPSLTSVFGSCKSHSQERQHAWRRVRGFDDVLTGCSICLTVYSDLNDSLLLRETDGETTAEGCVATSVGCAVGISERDDNGSNSIRDEGCMLLREGADDPYFDAEWNLIPMLNELWGEEARDAPKKRTAIKAKVLYHALKNVPLVSQQHVLSIRNLGEGSYGRVALGFCPGLGEIAVKWNKADDRPTNSLEFQHEAAMLATLQHPNVMGLLGLVTRSATEGEVVGFMTEYAPYGTLSAYIRRTRRLLPLRERVFLALQVARGMAFIHSCEAVHFDLKPDNVLVQRGHDVFPFLKIADLGLARWKVNGMVKAPGSLRGTLPYMAPELVCDVPLVSDKVDVWAFGCMLQEMATLEVPYSDMPSDEIVMGLMEGWLRPPIPVCEPEWQELLEHCLAFAPQSRPSFEELSCQLAILHDAC